MKNEYWVTDGKYRFGRRLRSGCTGRPYASLKTAIWNARAYTKKTKREHFVTYLENGKVVNYKMTEQTL